MRDPRAEEIQEREGAEWPYATILLLGYFGSHTEAGKKLARRTTWLLLLVIAASWTLHAPLEVVWLRLLVAAVMVSGVLGIGAAYAVYLRELDELSRTLQLRAAAFAYVATMTLAFAMYALSLALQGQGGEMPSVLLLVLIIVEPLRGAALAWFARRYQ